MTSEQNTNAKQFALAAAKLAGERHCTNIVVMDLTGVSPATDYFVIATGTSDRQMRALADEICQDAKKQKVQRFGRAGYEQARWILLDFLDVLYFPSTEVEYLEMIEGGIYATG